ncbi:MAG: esterase-like activity of phytase family protein [Acidobacteriota bacterium]
MPRSLLRRFSTITGLVALGAAAPAVVAQATTAHAESPQLRLIGHQSFDAQTVRYKGTVPGGLSGIEYDAESGRYLVISDDPATPDRGGARFYTVELDFDADGVDGYRFTSVRTLLRPDGTPFPEGGVDPESIRILPSGNLLWTSEGFERDLIDPFVREMTPDGRYVRDLEIPDRFRPTADPANGSRHNLVFESLTLTPDGRWAVTATEGALRQDGPEATPTNGSLSRVLFLDLDTGRPGAEYVYPNDPVRDATDGFSLNGLVELLALTDHTFLALERSFSAGFGHSVVLHHYDVSKATDVSKLDSLVDADVTFGEKSLVSDLGDFGLKLDNLEGITFGPHLENGNRSLVIVSDDNFGGVTQFLVFEVLGPLSPSDSSPPPSTTMEQGASDQRAPDQGASDQGSRGASTRRSPGRV